MEDVIIQKWRELAEIPPGRIPVTSRMAKTYKNVLLLYILTSNIDNNDYIINRILDNYDSISTDTYSSITEKLFTIIELDRCVKEMIGDFVECELYEQAELLHVARKKVYGYE